MGECPSVFSRRTLRSIGPGRNGISVKKIVMLKGATVRWHSITPPSAWVTWINEESDKTTTNQKDQLSPNTRGVVLLLIILKPVNALNASASLIPTSAQAALSAWSPSSVSAALTLATE